MSSDSIPLDSLRSLYSQHHGWLLGWLQRRLNCPDQAADLAQDTFVRLLVARWAPDVGTEPRRFLTHVAKGLVIDHWRRGQVERAYAQAVMHLSYEQTPSPEHRLIIIESLVRIETLLRALPLRTRDVFLLSQLDGLTLQQIAERSSMPVITVRRHVRKALIACLEAA